MEEGPRREAPRIMEAQMRGAADKGHMLILWSDAINQASYIRLALYQTFGWGAQEIDRHMERISTAGRSVLACDSGEHVEHYLHELRRFGLPATIEKLQ